MKRADLGVKVPRHAHCSAWGERPPGARYRVPSDCGHATLTTRVSRRTALGRVSTWVTV